MQQVGTFHSMLYFIGPCVKKSKHLPCSASGRSAAESRQEWLGSRQAGWYVN